MPAAEKTFDLSGYVKRTPVGTIDVQGTHLQFTQDIASLVAAERADGEVIAKAVEKAFKDRSVTTLGMNAILHYAMENLDVDPGNFNSIRDRVATFMRTNKNQYRVSKGKGGGVEWLHQADARQAPSSQPPSSGSIRPRPAIQVPAQ